MFANHPQIAKEFAAHTKNMKSLPEHKGQGGGDKPHHSGRGTKARINTAAEKMMFNSKFSK